MNPDENWKETRATAEDLSILLGVPTSTTEEFLKVLENLIIHRLVEVLSDSESEDVAIELPYLGSLVISDPKKKYPDISFVPRKAFYRKIKDACQSLKSPLTSQIGVALGQKLVQIFEEGDESNGKEKEKGT